MKEDANEKVAVIGTESKHRFRVRKPDFTPKWSREWVIPYNVLVPKDVEVEMQVNSKFPENRSTVDIDVIQAWDKGPVPAMSIPPLNLLNKKVVRNDHLWPSLKFSHENSLWNAFDNLDYNFECRIDQTTKRTNDALKVKRWHVQAVDIGDKRPSFPPMRASEKKNFESSFDGSADDERHAWEFDANGTNFRTFGEKMQNTYTFVYTGHGAVMCSDCGGMFQCKTGPGLSDADYGTWTACPMPNCRGGHARSTFCIGGWMKLPVASFMDGSHIATKTIVTSTPKYLMFSVCCGGGFEPSLYAAYLKRGTKYCIGFKKSTRCDWARDYAKSFFDTWVKTHKCDPSKIPTVFDGLKTQWEIKLQPVLFGDTSGGGAALRNQAERIEQGGI